MIFANITQSVNTRTDSTTQHNSINRYCILIKFLRMSVKDRYHKIKMRLISCCNVSCNSLGRQGGGRWVASFCRNDRNFNFGCDLRKIENFLEQEDFRNGFYAKNWSRQCQALRDSIANSKCHKGQRF